ncbi:hypothetical protein CU633_01830 [Bacillus sp. V3-13]|nr:hypothetical protein CU633_01830 [Bacillus sp. V3-13]
MKNWYKSNSLLTDAILNSATVVLQFVTDDSAGVPDLTLWAVISSNEVSGDVESILEEAVEFEGTTDLDGRMFSVE